MGTSYDSRVEDVPILRRSLRDVELDGLATIFTPARSAAAKRCAAEGVEA